MQFAGPCGLSVRISTLGRRLKSSCALSVTCSLSIGWHLLNVSGYLLVFMSLNLYCLHEVSDVS